MVQIPRGSSPVPFLPSFLPSLLWSSCRPPESEHVLLRGGRAAVAHPHGAGEPQQVVLAAPLVEPEHVVGRRSGGRDSSVRQDSSIKYIFLVDYLSYIALLVRTLVFGSS